MKFGYYSDKELPKSVALDRKPISDYKTNSHGYRCREFSPLPDGKKNVVVLGCSHTFGEGLEDNEHWVHFLSQHNTKMLRYWNLGQPGASADKVVRILYGCEKILFPNIIIVCWPFWSRRERLHEYAQSLMSYDEILKEENEKTDKQNFLKNVFFVEKLADKLHARVIHCFAQDVYELDAPYVFSDTSIKLCYPPWDDHNLPGAKKTRITDPSYAKDGIHYGIEHHQRFAELFVAKLGSKLK
jgi:hypothetical protein|tara:strand:+ start:767 stop:1492 length:726 start_codon:yes stop_codon:yes gene_type:complete